MIPLGSRQQVSWVRIQCYCCGPALSLRKLACSAGMGHSSKMDAMLKGISELVIDDLLKKIVQQVTLTHLAHVAHMDESMIAQPLLFTKRILVLADYCGPLVWTWNLLLGFSHVGLFQSKIL